MEERRGMYNMNYFLIKKKSCDTMIKKHCIFIILVMGFLIDFIFYLYSVFEYRVCALKNILNVIRRFVSVCEFIFNNIE